jgi:hypothetical protein
VFKDTGIHPCTAVEAPHGTLHQQNQEVLVLWFGLVLLVGKQMIIQM